MATIDSAKIKEDVDALLTEMGDIANRDVLADIVNTALRLATDNANRLDLKITATALREMRAAYRAFAPYRDRRKVTMFGSARTKPDSPLYTHAREMATALSAADWMVVTGAGPGIMAAGMEGAGRANSFGVNIRLPFEQSANAFIAKDPKLVEMKYFFTRKLMLIKESDAYVCLPGGFGTLDECFELLTLIQTGKAEPAPVVLLDMDGGTYWEGWERFVVEHVDGGGFITKGDECLWKRTSDVAVATEEILGFYRNYHSLRFVGKDLVLRLRTAPTDEQLTKLNLEFHDLLQEGAIGITEASRSERNDNDVPDLARIAFRFDKLSYHRLRQLIDALNQLDQA
ncbi:MAG TPA: LOG family protein [Acidimicrobiales bacterium]|nr:LOG family protein [Acidimicrobiales bacterium]